MAVGLLRTDLEGRCFYVSERVTDLTGLSAESAMQSGWEQCVHPDDREAVLRQVSSVLHARTPGQAEFRCVLPDGRIRWLLGQATPERDLEGRVVGFVWTLTDTTHTQEALRASEERYRLATKSAAIGVLDYDLSTDQGRWSPEVCALMGVREARLVTLAEALDFCHPDDRARVERAVAAALDPRGSGVFAETCRIRRGDTAEVRWLATTCQTIFDGAGDSRRPVRFTGITTDVTERKIREAQMQSLSELLQRNEDRQAFLLGLSDALRPLSDPLDVQEVASRLLGETLGVNRVGYAELEGGEYVVRREYVCGVAPLAGQKRSREFAAALIPVFRRGEIVVVSDVDTDPRFTESERIALQPRQIKAFVGVMLLKGGHLMAAFGANHATPRAWTQTEIMLIRDVAERTWDAVERARAEAALREREQRLRLALDASGGGSWTWDARSNHRDWDDVTRAQFGFTPEEPATEHGWISRVHDEDRPQVLGVLDEVLNGKDAWDCTFRIVLPDGKVKWIQSVGRADRAADGQVTRLTGLDLDVTERRQTEQALQSRRDQERDRELQLLLETATQGIVSVDAQARIVTANRALEAMFGWAPGTLIGESIERLVPASVRDAHVQHWTAYFAAPGPRPMGANHAIFGQRKDGSTFPLEVSLNHVPTAAGGHAIAFVTDITERKRREEFERFLFDLSRAFIAIPEESIDANMTNGLARVGTFLEMDRVALLELSPDRTTMTVVHAWNAPDTLTNPAPITLTSHMQPWWLRQVLRGEASLASHLDDLPEEAAAEKEYLRQRDVASVASIPLEVSGEIAGAISFATGHRHVSWTPELVNRLRAIGDILWNALRRHQAMQALLAAREAARESEERFRLIANTAPVMIWMSDADKQVTYVNQRWLDFTGWPPNEAPGHRWVTLIHPDDVERCGEVYGKAFDQRTPFEVEHRLRRHDSEYRWTVTVGVPRFGADRSFVGYVGTAVDVTDRRLAEVNLLESHRVLRERTVELEHRTAQLSRMASDLTLAEQHTREQLAKTLHDGLQQLLVSALMNLDRHGKQQSQASGPDELLERAKTHLDEAIAAARSLSLELFPPELHGSGLPAALRWLAERTRSQYGLVVTVSADPLANSDRKDVRTLLFESVRELLFNAVKHAQVDRVAIDLALDQDDALCITVADDGIGFDPAGLVERRQGGQAGWGLFSIRERLTLLGGRFDIESASGHGTRFRLVAPRGGAQDGIDADRRLTRAAAGSAARAATGVVPARALRILMVDDHAMVRSTFRDLLQRPEFQIVGEAGDGFEAIAEAGTLRPDVILMDVSMPRMNGVEATRRIHAELPFIQILGLSTYVKTEDLHPIERAGAAAYFTKAVDTQRLLDHLMALHAALILTSPSKPAER